MTTVYLMSFNKSYFLFLLIPFFHLFFYQMNIFEVKRPNKCLIAFKSNNLFGLLIFVNLIIGKIL